MKNKLDENFDEIRKILEQGKHELKNPSFENNLMGKLVAKKKTTVNVGNTIRYSLICFVGGMLLCVALVSILLFEGDLEFGTIAHILCFTSLFTLGVMGILFIENYLQLLRNYSTEN